MKNELQKNIAHLKINKRGINAIEDLRRFTFQFLIMKKINSEFRIVQKKNVVNWE